MSKCNNCTNRLETGDEAVAEPLNHHGSIDVSIRRGNFRFYHWKCIKKVPGLNKLSKIDWVHYGQKRQDKQLITS